MKRNVHLQQLETLQSEIAEYYRWLAEFPDVCRVLENLHARISSMPLSGADNVLYVGVNHLREEIRTMRAEPVLKWQPIESAPKDGTEVALLFAREQEVLGTTQAKVRAAKWISVAANWGIPYYSNNPPIAWHRMPAEPTRGPL